MGGRAASETGDPVSASCDSARVGAEPVPGAPGAACLVRPAAAEPCVTRADPGPLTSPARCRELRPRESQLRSRAREQRPRLKTQADLQPWAAAAKVREIRVAAERMQGEPEHLHPQFLHLLQRRSAW